ncbi:unnamed protein product [Chrysodeixis includens]|uniref:Uncharacterized protein n=1 Tax=Chrysodeixis includens TaxID=689277 RepID=A0A9P0FYX9_CHRIL|nr:unnamed protein product [Chrysodeixis includens]
MLLICLCTGQYIVRRYISVCKYLVSCNMNQVIKCKHLYCLIVCSNYNLLIRKHLSIKYADSISESMLSVSKQINLIQGVMTQDVLISMLFYILFA